MDYDLVRKLLKNGELLYDDTTKSITMNMNLIESSDADNSTVQAVKTNFKVPPALKERILATKVKNKMSKNICDFPMMNFPNCGCVVLSYSEPTYL